VAERLRVLAEHITLFDALLGEVKSIAVMKKHYKAYLTGFAGAERLRTDLMATHTATEALNRLR
jgi:tRNA-dihydrouridine synthase